MLRRCQSWWRSSSSSVTRVEGLNSSQDDWDALVPRFHRIDAQHSQGLAQATEASSMDGAWRPLDPSKLVREMAVFIIKGPTLMTASGKSHSTSPGPTHRSIRVKNVAGCLDPQGYIRGFGPIMVRSLAQQGHS